MEISVCLTHTRIHTLSKQKRLHDSEFAQLYLILCDPMDCSLPCSLVHGILQARILDWVAIFFSKVATKRSRNCALINSFTSTGLNSNWVNYFILLREDTISRHSWGFQLLRNPRSLMYSQIVHSECGMYNPHLVQSSTISVWKVTCST